MLDALRSNMKANIIVINENNGIKLQYNIELSKIRIEKLLIVEVSKNVIGTVVGK